MARKASPERSALVPRRRRFTDEFRRDAVQMMLDGHSAATVAERLRISCPTLLLVHHTDRGGQYAGTQYRAVLARAGMKQSMSRPDNCYDNAFMESCFGTFKLEMEMTDYESVESARAAVAEYVRYYRFERKHSSI